MKVKEVRKLSSVLIQQYCIRRGYCTMAYEDEFKDFLKDCERCANADVDFLYETANFIYDKTNVMDYPDFPERQILASIMFDLVKECSITYFI